MDSKRVDRWMTLGANIAVLIGIVLIIVELRQNHELMRAATRNEISQSELALLGSMASNPELVETMLRAGRGEDLTDAERFLVTVQSEAVFRVWQNVHYQGRNGLYDRDEFQSHIATMRAVLSHSPWLIDYWCQSRAVYPREFIIEINGLVPAGSCQ